MKMKRKMKMKKLINDELDDFKVSKRKTSKPNIIIDDNSKETKEKNYQKIE